MEREIKVKEGKIDLKKIPELEDFGKRVFFFKKSLKFFPEQGLAVRKTDETKKGKGLVQEVSINDTLDISDLVNTDKVIIEIKEAFLRIKPKEEEK